MAPKDLLQTLTEDTGMRRLTNLCAGLITVTFLVSCEEPMASDPTRGDPTANVSVVSAACVAAPIPAGQLTNGGVVLVFNSTCSAAFLIRAERQVSGAIGFFRQRIEAQTQASTPTPSTNSNIVSACLSPVQFPSANESLRCFDGFRGPTNTPVFIPTFVYAGPPSPIFATPSPPYIRGAPNYTVRTPIRRVQPTNAWPARRVTP